MIWRSLAEPASAPTGTTIAPILSSALTSGIPARYMESPKPCTTLSEGRTPTKRSARSHSESVTSTSLAVNG